MPKYKMGDKKPLPSMPGKPKQKPKPKLKPGIPGRVTIMPVPPKPGSGRKTGRPVPPKKVR